MFTFVHIELRDDEIDYKTALMQQMGLLNIQRKIEDNHKESRTEHRTLSSCETQELSVRVEDQKPAQNLSTNCLDLNRSKAISSKGTPLDTSNFGCRIIRVRPVRLRFGEDKVDEP